MLNVAMNGNKSSIYLLEIGRSGIGLPVLIILWHHIPSFIRGFYFVPRQNTQYKGKVILGALTANPLRASFCNDEFDN